MTRARTILIAALGGQGGGVLAQWLVTAAARAGFHAQATSIPGVAQRTGATTYYVEIYPEPIASLGGRKPVLGLYPVPGGIDLLIVSELLEAARMVQAGMASPEETLVVASTSRTLTTIEKMALTDGRIDTVKLLEVARSQSRRLVAFDMDAAAREAGTVVSAVMAGAIAASGAVPFSGAEIEAAIRASGVGVESSLLGFEAGFARVSQPGEVRDPSSRCGPVSEANLGPGLRRCDGFPPALRDIVELGTERVREFQDGAYADLYVQRVSRILAAERAIDPLAAHGYALARETARFLALWMAFDDLLRVAWLKSRPSRFARVRREVGARPGDIVRIVDHFKPGVPEMAGVLPPALASRLVAWDRRRQERGERPWGWSIRLRADSIVGFLALRMLSGLKRVRRLGVRYRHEQALIERWLAAIESAARADWRTGQEIALCGRLIKGYGDTNERAKMNFTHILDHVVNGKFMTASSRADAIRDAREAALADEGGKALRATLAGLGVAALPPVVRPITLVRRKPSGRIAAR
jgi:indolepyruvate ferredoxin oxidoreductase beta subunit